MENIQSVPVLLRREIEAAMVVPFLRAFAEKFGRDETMEVAKNVMADIARESGKQLAEFVGGNSITHLCEKVTPLYEKGNALSMEIRRTGETSLEKDVSHCAYVEMYERLGMKEFGFLLSCARDEYMFKGFNPDFKFSRSTTLMEGGKCCDIRITI